MRTNTLTKEQFNAIKKAKKKYPYYYRAKTIHRNHKGKVLKIEPGSFLEAIYKDGNVYIVIKKATQCGISEYLVVRVVYRAEIGRSVFYVIPTDNLKNQFVKERFDKPLLLSPYYRGLSRTEDKLTESVSLKQLGKGVVGLVGSNSPVGFISFQADDEVVDEYDRCNQENIVMGKERQSRSEDKTTIYVSNPTLDDFGIDEKIKETDNKFWFIECDCGERFEIDWFKHIVREVNELDYVIIDPDYDPETDRDARVICHKCNRPVDRYKVGEWVWSQKSKKSGYNISSLFSTNVTVREMLDIFSDGLADETVMTRFHNAYLGRSYSPPGAKILEAHLNTCVSEYRMPETVSGITVMGVDVGKRYHIVIRQILPGGKSRAVYIGSVFETEEVATLYKQYKCKIGVIDSRPETREAKKLCKRFKGMFMCDYIHGMKDSVSTDGSKIIKADRTSSIDAVRAKFISEQLLLPINAKSIDEYYDHITGPTRVFNERRNEYEWIVGSKKDHFLHAEVYADKAERILKGL